MTRITKALDLVVAETITVAKPFIVVLVVLAICKVMVLISNM